MRDMRELWILLLALAAAVEGNVTEPAETDSDSDLDSVSDPVSGPVSTGSRQYHTQTQLVDTLSEICHDYPHLAEMYPIGKTVKGLDLWVLKLTGKKTPPLGTPEVRYMAGVHGREVVQTEMLLQLAEYLVVNYSKDKNVTWLLDNTIIHILPRINADTYRHSVPGQCSMDETGNTNNVFVAQDFPYPGKGNDSQPQPETEAIMKWSKSKRFVLSGTLHGSTISVFYPYSQGESDEPSPYSATPDDDVLRYVSISYSRRHKTMHSGTSCSSDGTVRYPNGIANAAVASLQPGQIIDYEYMYNGCLEVYIGIVCCRHPKADELDAMWEQNKEALVRWMEEAHKGVRGQVVDSHTGKPLYAADLTIEGRNITFHSKERTGEFWRVLLPGTYQMKVESKGYESQNVSFTIPISNLNHNKPVWLVVRLTKARDPNCSGAHSDLLKKRFDLILSLFGASLLATFLRFQ